MKKADLEILRLRLEKLVIKEIANFSYYLENNKNENSIIKGYNFVLELCDKMSKEFNELEKGKK